MYSAYLYKYEMFKYSLTCEHDFFYTNTVTGTKRIDINVILYIFCNQCQKNLTFNI